MTMSRWPVPWLGIGDDREVGETVHHRDGAQVEEVAGGRIEAAHAPLAEDDVGIALGQDVFRREQQLLDGGGETSLQQNRLPGAAGALQQRIVLHVPGADLDDVGDLGHEVHAPRHPSPR